MIRYKYTPAITLSDSRYNMIGSIKNWENVLRADVLEHGMGLEETRQKHNYNSYKKWGQKRFDQVYKAYIEMYKARVTPEQENAKSTKMVYILIAVAIGLVIAFVFLKLSKK